MKILMVSHTSNAWTSHFAEFFVRRGDNLLVASMTPDPIDDGQLEFIGVEPFDIHGNKHRYITRAPRLRAIAKRFRPDVVFAPYISSNGMIASLAWKGPLVLSGMGSDVLVGTRGRGVFSFLRRQVIRYVCRRASAIHVVSSNIERALTGFGVPAAKIHQFPLGVDVQRFSPAADTPRADGQRLICVRKHEPIYDIPTILESLAELRAQGRAFHCTFVGGGSRLDDHRRRAEELGLHGQVVFLGHVAHDELPNHLRAADIYISASLSDGASSSLLEAMASGLLPVVTDIDANTPWVQHGVSGLIFPPGDVRMLTQSLEIATSDFELRRRAVAANRELVISKGNQQTNDRRLAALLESVVRDSRSESEFATSVN